jgi:hypothetical protein
MLIFGGSSDGNSPISDTSLYSFNIGNAIFSLKSGKYRGIDECFLFFL